MEVLKNTLLLFTILILVYALYRRLITILRKDEINKRYPAIGNELRWSDDDHATIEVTIQEKMNLTIELFNMAGDKIALLTSQEYIAGDYQFPVDLSNQAPGKYYYKITSEDQQASQYFHLK